MMSIERVDLQPIRYAYLRHSGPYNEIGSTFGQMAAIANPAGLVARPGALFVGVYHDDPMSNPPETLRSDAGITVANDTPIPDQLQEATIPGGKYVKGIHKGPYDKMNDTWHAIYQAIHAQNIQTRMVSPFELYISDMDTTPPDELITEIYVAVE